MSLSDHFNISQFKNKIKSLKYENRHLHQTINQLNQENWELQRQLSFKLSIAQMTPFQLNDLIEQKQRELNQLNQQANDFLNEVNHYRLEATSLTKQIKKLKLETADLEDESIMSDYGLYTPHYEFATVLEYKAKLNEIRAYQKQMIKDKSAVTYDRNWTVNGSKTAGNKMNRNNIKAILRSFNNECTDAINKVTVNNFDRIHDRITRSFEQHNAMYEVVEIHMVPNYLKLKIEEAHIALEYSQKREAEKEALRAQREKEREEKRLQKEVETKQKSINKEINHYKKAIDELKARLSSLEGQELLNVQQNINQLSQNIQIAENEKNELDYRQQNATAGYVYIISNIGSFGKNVIKIGVTRRLDPMERISELSSASVPFKFDVHALIFSYDAYKLESELHHRFEDSRINKVNARKEYFGISIEDIKYVLQDYNDLTVDFNEIPEATEYRETLAIIHNQHEQVIS